MASQMQFCSQTCKIHKTTCDTANETDSNEQVQFRSRSGRLHDARDSTIYVVPVLARRRRR